MKKFKSLTLVLIILMFISLLPIPAAALDDPETEAAAVVVMDTDTGDILFSKNAGQSRAPASTTKLMTALLVAEAIEEGSIGLADEVTASDNCQYNLDVQSSHANPAIVPGEVLSVEELLYCAMLASANEACNILAEYVSGSVDEFVELMNRRAAELGCADTHFSDANGMGGSSHYTTAHDLALIAREAVTHTLILTVCGAASYTVPATNVAQARELANTNQLLNADSNYYNENAYGLKTGFTSEAGYCLVSAGEYNDINIVSVVMGCPEDGQQFSNSDRMLDWVFDNFSRRTILSSTTTLDTVPVEMGDLDSTGVRAENSVILLLPNDQDLGNVVYEVTYNHEINGETLMAPINAGDTLGQVTVLMDGVEYGTSRLVATASVEMSRLEYLRSQLTETLQTPAVRQIITILIILLAVYLLLVLFYWIQRVRHLHSMRVARRDRAIARAQQEAQWLDIPEPEYDDPNIDFFPEEDEDDDYDPLPPAQDTDDDYYDSYY